MKTFLAFMVVTVNIVVMFCDPSNMGLGYINDDLGWNDWVNVPVATIVLTVFSYTFQLANHYYVSDGERSFLSFDRIPFH